MRHEITATEPKMVTQKLNMEDGVLQPTDNIVEMRDMDTGLDQKNYECSCGEQFNSIEEAETHMNE